LVIDDIHCNIKTHILRQKVPQNKVSKPGEPKIRSLLTKKAVKNKVVIYIFGKSSYCQNSLKVK
jgi:hypothetical protein